MKKSGIGKRMKIAVLTGILTASCAFSPMTAIAAKTKPELFVEAISSTTGKAVSGAELSVYQVAGLADNGVYSLTELFLNSGLLPDLLSTASVQREQAKKMSDYVTQNKIAAAAELVTDQDGKASRPEMEKGLYLVRLTGNRNPKEVVELEPFFVSLPAFQEDTGTWLYQVTAKPKISTSDVPVNPTKPDDTTDPADPTEPTNPADPNDPTNPTNPTDPSDPTNPTNPTDPSDPTNPSNPTNPTTPPDSDRPSTSDRPRPPIDTDGPGPGDPTVIIEDEPTPLASFPQTPAEPDPELIIIEDGPVPLANFPNVPKLGDMGADGYLAGVVISLILCGVAVTARVCYGRKED